MSTALTEKEIQRNYDCFVAELTKLTRKYGIAIQSVGNVSIADHAGEFAALSYRADITSGDLYPDWPED